VILSEVLAKQMNLERPEPDHLIWIQMVAKNHRFSVHGSSIVAIVAKFQGIFVALIGFFLALKFRYLL
jgi:hypothetical protein